MNDREFLDEFVRVERTEDEIHVSVREIHWEGRSHSPVSAWVIARTLPATVSESEIENAVARVVEEDGYFLVARK